ncbi:MAG: hypothetical protein ACKVOR_01995 [Flavobacteriales bacterium]
MQTPDAANMVTKASNIEMLSQLKAQDKISTLLDTLSKQLDKLNEDKADVAKLKSNIEKTLEELKTFEDSTTLGSVMKNVNIAFVALKNEKLDLLVQANSSQQTLKDMRKDSTDTHRLLLLCKEQLLNKKIAGED